MIFTTMMTSQTRKVWNQGPGPSCRGFLCKKSKTSRAVKWKTLMTVTLCKISPGMRGTRNWRRLVKMIGQEICFLLYEIMRGKGPRKRWVMQKLRIRKWCFSKNLVREPTRIDWFHLLLFTWGAGFLKVWTSSRRNFLLWSSSNVKMAQNDRIRSLKP